MSNPLGYHYPAGAEHDPRAPWNWDDEDPAHRRARIAEEKADAALDAAKDRDE